MTTQLYTESYLQFLTSQETRKHIQRLANFRETHAMFVPNKGKLRKQKAIAERRMIDACASYAPMFEDSMEDWSGIDGWKQP